MKAPAWFRPFVPGIAVGRIVGGVAYTVVAVATVPAGLRWWSVLFVAVTLLGMLYSWRVRSDQPIRRLIGLFFMAAGGHALYVVDPHSPGWFPAASPSPSRSRHCPCRWP